MHGSVSVRFRENGEEFKLILLKSNSIEHVLLAEALKSENAWCTWITFSIRCKRQHDVAHLTHHQKLFRQEDAEAEEAEGRSHLQMSDYTYLQRLRREAK